MKRFVAPALCLALALPVAAEETAPQDDPGLGLMERGARMFIEGLLSEMEPALKDLERLAQELGPRFMLFADEMGPALADLLEQVEDWTAYHPPEILPNGDIIIRRKSEAERMDEGEEIDI